MMKCAVDLHIHSCLSPCAGDDMTPCNIAGMAYVKHLDCIALTDHNAAENLPAAALAAREMGVCLLPGIEVTSSEEVHILCYFPAVDPAVDFGRMIYDHLPPLPNNKRIFGNQMILGPEDEAQGELSKLLAASAWRRTSTARPTPCSETSAFCPKNLCFPRWRSIAARPRPGWTRGTIKFSMLRMHTGWGTFRKGNSFWTCRSGLRRHCLNICTRAECVWFHKSIGS